MIQMRWHDIKFLIGLNDLELAQKCRYNTNFQLYKSPQSKKL